MHAKEPGHPWELDGATGKTLAELVDVVTEAGDKTHGEELSRHQGNFLDTILGLPNNLLGDRWVKRFAKRCQMSERVASNIRQARASISQEISNEFFDEFVGGFGNIPPSEKMFNFDKTNFTDDPGMKKCFVGRGARCVEKIREHSTTDISVMWCRSASDATITAMVFYKAQNVHEGWTTSGLRWAVYDCTPSGWIDG